jgi:hypothetical protein
MCVCNGCSDGGNECRSVKASSYTSKQDAKVLTVTAQQENSGPSCEEKHTRRKSTGVLAKPIEIRS